MTSRRNIGPMVALMAILALATTTHAQSFNINFTGNGTGPDDNYPGVGIDGHWNNLIAVHGSTTFDLVDVDGNVTKANMWQFGGQTMINAFDPSVAGDHGKLMNSGLVTYSAGLESCLFFHDLEPGEYEITIYARMPESDTIVSYTSCDEEAGFPHHVVGGEWSGNHQEFVTFSRHTAVVTTGLLRTHSGIVPRQSPTLGAAFNGIQVRKLRACPADVSGEDNVVDVADLLALLAAWGTSGDGADLAQPLNVVDVTDLLELLSSWGTCTD